MPDKAKNKGPVPDLKTHIIDDNNLGTPSTGVIGTGTGGLMPRTVSGLIYNPDTITVKTYQQMEDDAQIKAVLTIIKAPIQSVVWSISSEDSEVAEFCKDALQLVWGNLINAMLNALNFGFQGFEKIWRDLDGYWVYKKFLDLHPDTINIRVNEQGDFDGLEQQTIIGGPAIIPVEKSFVFTNEKRFGNFYGRAKLRSAYTYWFIDKYTYDFENMYFERYAQPIVKGSAPSGFTQTGGNTSSPAQQDNLEYLLTILKGLRGSSAIVLPSDTDPVTKERKWAVDFLEAERRGADFTARHNQLDLMKARAIFAPELVFSSPMGGSSYALAREHATVFTGAEEAILTNIKHHIDHYILPQLVVYNFGVNAARAVWDYEAISTETKNLIRDLVVAMVEGDLVRPDPEWLAKTLKIKLKETTKEDIDEGAGDKLQQARIAAKLAKTKGAVKVKDGTTDSDEYDPDDSKKPITQVKSRSKFRSDKSYNRAYEQQYSYPENFKPEKGTKKWVNKH